MVRAMLRPPKINMEPEEHGTVHEENHLEGVSFSGAVSYASH